MNIFVRRIRYLPVLSMISLFLFALLFSPSSTSGTIDQVSLSFLRQPTPILATESKFTEQVESWEESIDFSTVYVKDDSYELGTEVITREGSPGKKRVIQTTVTYDGEDYSTSIEEDILIEAENQVIVQGTKIVLRTIESEYGNLTYSQTFSNMWATSYDSTCSGCSTTTATGMKQGYGVVAVDPTVIPLYSKVFVPGYGIALVGDVGGSIKGNRIDLGYDSLGGQWKAHSVDVYLLVD